LPTLDEFQGTIGQTHLESSPWFADRAHPGEDTPNVVVILLDDTGFAHFGCYGSEIDTPNIDALAANGLQYTNFHVTPLCSPTRAALLTGRNHHSVGMRCLANFNTGYPNMTGHISNHAGTVAEVLREEGYTTFAVGKWHLCQMADASAAGPFDQWPLQRGFDRYYGFLEGETDQYSPDLTYDNHRVDAPALAEDGYHLSEDLVDRAIGFVHDAKSVRPDRPFFCYLAFGATHAPHQAPPAYMAKYRGQFDAGWDVARQRWFARQLELGLVPEGTELAPRNPGVDPWDDLSENQRRLAARLQEAFAAFLDHTDDQIGRFIDDLANLGELDNTLVFVLADNGASQEGGPFGVLHEMKFFNGILETPDDAIAQIDEIGGPHSHSNYPWGWAQAGNTPFKWYKQNTHEGGVHVPLVVHWPNGIAERGGIRRQFHHVNDIVPSIYEVIGVDPPSIYRGREQMPVTGTSMRYTFDDPAQPSRKTVQYFEMAGHRGIYSDGWKAVTRHQAGVPYDDDVWELYHVAEDFSECHDLASEMPDKLAEMIERWWYEAEEHGVLPLDDRLIELFGARFADRTPHAAHRRYSYRPPMSPLPAQAGAALGGRGWDMVATIDRSSTDEGVLYATGTENAGFSFFVQGRRLVFDYNAFGRHEIVVSDLEVPVGPSLVAVQVRRTGARTGTVELLIDDEACGRAELPLLMTVISSVGPSVGHDHGSAVSERYRAPFPFSGALHRVDIDTDPDGKHHEAPEVAAALLRAETARQ
jgi:arylsulfatase A-like enzyme